MTGRHFLMSLCVLALVFSEADAQRAKRTIKSSRTTAISSSGTIGTSISAADALTQFKENNTGARFYGSQFYQPTGPEDEARGGMTSVYGTILSTGDTPEQSAWNHFNELRGALGTEVGTMVPEVKPHGDILQGVMWNEATQEYKFSVLRFNQFYQGLPVFRSGVGFMVRNQTGNPLVMSGFTVKDLTGNAIVVPGEKSQATVSRKMTYNVRQLMDAAPIERSVLEGKRSVSRLPIENSEEQFVVFAGVNGEFAVPELAVSFVATRGSIRTLPDYHKYLVIASVATGEILHEETLICHCSACIPPVDVNGNVAGRATQGLATLECNAEASVPLPYAEVSIGGTTVNADANGDFTIPNGGTGNVTVVSQLRGTWFEVFDESAGGATPSLSQTLSPPGPANFTHNPTNGNDLMTANVNAYVESNVVRDFVLNYEPNYPTIWNQTGFNINTNIASSCNAFYDGGSINFYQNGGGCNNTSFSDVIYHEYGHHLINVTGNGQGQMGEGSGDAIGVLIQDDPILGQGFQQNCGSGIRTANNSLQYPCSGGVHACGQLISGCVWDTWSELKATDPANAQDISASLFLGMLIVRGQMNPGQSEIAPDITVIYLELDDDDGDIGNGTPHYAEIATGFGLHNMDAPPLELVEFNYPQGLPDFIPHNGGVAFNVQVTPASSGAPEPGTGLLHVDFGSGFQSYAMGETSPNNYQAIFPTQPCGTVARYYVSVESTTGELQNDPSDAPNTSNSGTYASTANTVFYDNGQSSTGWSVSGDATDGQWDRGNPVGGGDRGDPATDGDGSGACWLTDNEDGNSDVDGGSTILTSPTMNAIGSATEVAVLKYKSFYTNNFGAEPFADEFVVEISNNGGASWSPLESVGPTGTESAGGWFDKGFLVSDFITPTSNMKVRFNASDLAGGSVVEAGVDGLEIVMADCVPVITAFATKFRDGSPTGGGLADAGDSNNTYYQLDPSPTTNPVKQKIEVIFLTELSNTSPDSFAFRVEASMNGGPAGDVKQKIALYNLATDSWEELSVVDASQEDTVAEAVGTGDLTRFINQANGEVTARVTWESPSFLGSTFFWDIDLDQAVWVTD